MNNVIVDVVGGPRQAAAMVLGLGLIVGVGAVLALSPHSEHPRQHAEALAQTSAAIAAPSGHQASHRRGVAGFAPASITALTATSPIPEASFTGVGCIGAYLESVRGTGLPETTPLAPGLRRDSDGVVRGPAQLWPVDADVAACFDESGPIDATVLAQVEARLRQGQPKFNIGARWSSTATNGAVSQGQPITLTWSFIPDGIPAAPDDPNNPSLDNSVLFARMDQLFGNNRALWISKFQEAFDRWGALTGVTYVRVSTGGNDWDDGAAWGATGSLGFRGDVRIGMRNIDNASNVLAFNFFPNSSSAGDMVLDSSENWGSSSNNYRFLRNVVMHEHGHGLGLSHVCPTNLSKLMEPTYTSNFDGPQQDDARAVQELYGDSTEPNNAVNQGFDLGTVAPSVVVTRGTPAAPAVSNVSLYSVFGNDIDWFRFSITQPLLMRVTATPLGSTYATAGCSTAPAQTNTNALAMGDLQVAVAGSTGSPFIVTSNAAAAGAVEQVTNLLLDAGTYTFRVGATNNPTDPQMYTVTVAASQAPTLAASPRVAGVQLSWINATNSNYTIFRSTSPLRAFAVQVGSTANSSFLDSTAPAGTPVTYWVEASQAGRTPLPWGGPAQATAIRDCGVADIAGPGTSIGPDGELTADDVIVFIGWFTNADARADVAGPGAVAGPDSEFTADDVIFFINRFTAGCL